MLRKKSDLGTFRLVAQRLNHYGTPGTYQQSLPMINGRKVCLTLGILRCTEVKKKPEENSDSDAPLRTNCVLRLKKMDRSDTVSETSGFTRC